MRQNRKKDVKPLEMEQCKIYLTQLRDIMNEEIPMAAEAIQILTGPITIRQEPIAGKNRVRWVAKFTPDLMCILRKVSNEKDVLDSISLEKGDQTDGEEVVVPLEKIPEYEKLAPEFFRLSEKGASIQSIASAHGMGWQYTKEIIYFAKTGERPKWKAGKRTGKGGKPNKYLKHVDKVVHMKDVQHISFQEIARKLKISTQTVGRAYDHAHQDEILHAVKNGQKPDRGRYTNLGEEVHLKIREMLQAGENPKVIASEVGCGITTVRRTRTKLQE